MTILLGRPRQRRKWTLKLLKHFLKYCSNCSSFLITFSFSSLSCLRKYNDCNRGEVNLCWKKDTGICWDQYVQRMQVLRWALLLQLNTLFSLDIIFQSLRQLIVVWNACSRLHLNMLIDDWEPPHTALVNVYDPWAGNCLWNNDSCFDSYSVREQVYI